MRVVHAAQKVKARRHDAVRRDGRRDLDWRAPPKRGRVVSARDVDQIAARQREPDLPRDLIDIADGGIVKLGQRRRARSDAQKAQALADAVDLAVVLQTRFVLCRRQVHLQTSAAGWT